MQNLFIMCNVPIIIHYFLFYLFIYLYIFFIPNAQVNTGSYFSLQWLRPFPPYFGTVQLFRALGKLYTAIDGMTDQLKIRTENKILKILHTM